MFAGIGVIAILLVGAGVALASFRYFPAVEEARLLRADVEAVGFRLQAAGMGIDRQEVDGLRQDVTEARERLEGLASMLASDPLIGLARILPMTSADVQGADAIVSAADDVFSATEHGLTVADRYVEIKASQAADPENASALALLVELMATTQEPAATAAAALERAEATLATVPSGLAGPIESARAAMTSRIETYAPMLDAYLAVGGDLPGILGWDEPKRYLVLTQNPAELRPTGGFIGSYGLLSFDKGRITERTFQDVTLLDLPWDYPHIEPPQELADYLLGPDQPWQLADANWSPDFPTSAQTAVRLYANESGDTSLDGVIGITTKTIDQLLRITGPVTVPNYEATLAPGETTLKVLQLTRASDDPDTNRKAFLSALADELIATLLHLPPERWGDLLGSRTAFQADRLLLAWFTDSAHQELVARHGFDGRVRQDAGDYLYPVDSNVAPVSKLSAMTTRALALHVELDAYGNARNTLEVIWDNRILSDDGAAYRELPMVGDLRILGLYFRVLVPERSRLESVSGGRLVPVTAPAVVQEEAGRVVIGNYLKVPPGPATLRYSWISPYAALTDESGGLYRLVIQKQPGLEPGPIALSIRVPEGSRITEASGELTVSAQVVSLETTFERDISIAFRYGP